MVDKSRPKKATDGRNAGVGVDAQGDTVLDPTENVKALSEAANKRQDDLRDMHNRLTDVQITSIKEIMEIRAAHSREMRDLESKRLDAIRSVDQLAVNTAASQALAAIQTLAATTTTSADVLRNALTNTAATIATQTANTVSAITERLAALEKLSYEGTGRSAVADPQLVELTNAVRGLLAAQAAGSGKSTGMQATWSIIAMAISMFVGLIAIGTFVFITTRQPAQQPQQQQQPMIYQPATPGTLLPRNAPTPPTER